MKKSGEVIPPVEKTKRIEITVKIIVEKKEPVEADLRDINLAAK